LTYIFLPHSRLSPTVELPLLAMNYSTLN